MKVLAIKSSDMPVEASLWSKIKAFMWILALVLFAYHSGMAEEQYIDHDGFLYRFKMLNSPELLEGHIFVLDTFAPKSKVLRTRIPSVPPNRCEYAGDINPKVLTSPSGRQYIAFCRNDLERSQTLYILSHGELYEQIEFDSSPPNIRWDEKLNAFAAEAYPRLPDTTGSLAWFLVVYAWNPESYLDKKAHPVFNTAAARYYQAFYDTNKLEVVKHPDQRDNWLTPMIAALVSTVSPEMICQKMSESPLAQLTAKQIESYLVFVTKYGFPRFDLTQCKRRP